MRVGQVVRCLGQQSAGDAGEEVQLSGLLRRLPPFQEREEGVLCFGQVAEQFGQGPLRVRQRQTLDVIAELVDGFGCGALGGEESEPAGAFGCHGDDVPFVAG